MGWVIRKPVVLTAMMVLVVLVFAGCLQCQHDIMIRYDPGQDQFAVLNVYRGYVAEKPEDLDVLELRWRDRASIYDLPLMSALLKRPDGRFDEISLQVPTTRPTPCTIPAALDSLKVIPGKLFVENEVLCYYDQVIVPGKLTDELLAHAVKLFTPDLAKGINEELAARNGAGASVSWTQVRSAIENEQQDESIEPQKVLSTESLKMLRERLEAGSMCITRQKQLLSLTIPLSPADVKEAVATIEVADRKVRELIEKKGPGYEMAEMYLRGVKWDALADGMKVTVDVTALPSMAGKLSDYRPAADDVAKSKQAIKAMEDRKLPIDRQTHAADVVEEFGRGALGGRQ